MATIVQIRNVPDDLRRRLKERAATEGVSMSDFIVREVGKALDQPTRASVVARLKAQPISQLKRAAAEIVRAARTRRR